MTRNGPVRWKLWALTALLAVAAVAATVLVRENSRPVQDPGRAAAEQLAREYVSALNTNSPAQLGRLLHQPAGSPHVRERLTQYGGRGLTVARVTIWQGFVRLYDVLLETRDRNGQPVRLYESFHWQRDGEHWSVGRMVPPSQIPSPSVLGTPLPAASADAP